MIYEIRAVRAREAVMKTIRKGFTKKGVSYKYNINHAKVDGRRI